MTNRTRFILEAIVMTCAFALVMCALWIEPIATEFLSR